MNFNWERLVATEETETYRAKVDGGWLYRYTSALDSSLSSAMVFVPEAPSDLDNWKKVYDEGEEG